MKNRLGCTMHSIETTSTVRPRRDARESICATSCGQEDWTRRMSEVHIR